MAEKGSKFLQYLAVCAANMSTIACGAVLGWTSPILPKLSEDSPIAPDNPLGRPITKHEGSWIGSSTPLGVMCGCLVSGYLAERMGRKGALLITTIPIIIGWITLGTATTTSQMYVGRFVLGIGLSISFSTIPMYTGEISEPSIRGTLGAFMQIFITIGFLLSYCVGPYTSYTFFWMFCLTLYIIFFVCFIFMPESPYFLVSQGQEMKAAVVLAKFRGLGLNDVNMEIEEIKKEIEKAKSETTSWKDVLKHRVDRKSLVIMVSVISFLELMGIDVVMFYVEFIFKDAGVRDTALSTIIVGLVQVLATIMMSTVVDKSGRKILLVISSIGAGISVGILGVYFYLLKDHDMSNVTWIPLATLVVYVAFYSIGWGPVPWVILGEIFSPKIKSKGASICVFSVNTLSFVMTKFFTNAEAAFGAHVCFWFFSFCCVLEIVFVLSAVPETKGKTLAEIQRKLGRKNVHSTQSMGHRNEIYLESKERF